MSTRAILVVAGGVALILAIYARPTPPGRNAPKSAGPAGESKAASVCDPAKKPANLDFRVKDMHGQEIDLATFKGRVLLLDFWATWCGPCKIEIPAFVELYSKYRAEGLSIVGVSVDDPVDKLKVFAAELRMNYPVLVGLGRDDIIEEAYGPIFGIPTTFLIGRNGTICKKHVGFAPKEQFEREIKALL